MSVPGRMSIVPARGTRRGVVAVAVKPTVAAAPPADGNGPQHRAEVAATLSRTVEEYLRALYELGEQRGGTIVGTGTLALTLGISPSVASKMTVRLAQLLLVERTPRRGAALTPEGRAVALKVLRRHRLLKTFLHRALGYGWEEVQREADLLAPAVSDEFEARLDAALDHPLIDPCGQPIPTREGTVAPAATRPLAALHAHETGVIGWIGTTEPAKLRYLAELGLRPGVAVTLLGSLPFDGPLRLHVGAAGPCREQVLGDELAQDIFIDSA